MTTGAVHDHINSLSKSNSRRGRVVLNGMFDLAERLDAIQRNPVRATKRKKERAKAVQALSLEQIDRVRSVIYKHDKTRRGPKSGYTLSDFFDIMIGTGLRPGELLTLQWSDINLRYKGSKVTISVTGTLQHRDGKQKGPLVKSEYPKTDAGIRTFIAPGYVATILRRLHRNRSITPTNAVFHTRSGGFVSLNNIDRALRNIREDLDLEWMTAHTLRKTAATHITEELGEEQAARVLGHNDQAVTRKYYIDKTRFTGDATPALERLGPDYRASHLRVASEGEEVTG
ncbi:tyrosine-type recombinase/integrase [Aeromicrobium sp. 179-A 4D2 NHS]|uniref:tyrosine-type recombinase/integrase n=1 Tax=Aeromicrobium sp. 179-A 4D2 NHS TaxID=3142375 RepID=UPI00399F7ADF